MPNRYLSKTHTNVGQQAYGNVQTRIKPDKILSTPTFVFLPRQGGKTCLLLTRVNIFIVMCQHKTSFTFRYGMKISVLLEL